MDDGTHDGFIDPELLRRAADLAAKASMFSLTLPKFTSGREAAGVAGGIEKIGYSVRLTCTFATPRGRDWRNA